MQAFLLPTFFIYFHNPQSNCSDTIITHTSQVKIQMHSYYEGGYVFTTIYWFVSRIMLKDTERVEVILWVDCR